MALESINPATGKVIATLEEIEDENIAIKKVFNSYDFFQHWKFEDIDKRKHLLLNVAKILRTRKEKYGELMTLEMGKPILQAIAEAEKCALVCEYYAENASKILKRETIPSDASESYVQFDPIGVVLAVMPWNFPFWQVFRFAAPAIMAGNVCVLKHASNVPQCAKAIEQIFIEAGFPESVFVNLPISSGMVSSIIERSPISGVSLTGSEFAGSNVAKLAGKVLIKSVLELGGSDPFIVLKDANIDEAVKVGVFARTMNNGQSCIAAKRFIIESQVFDEFSEKFVSAMNNLSIGNPLQEEIDLGPIAREDLRFQLENQVEASVNDGASILCGGKSLDSEGFFFQPTVISDLTQDMPTAQEEIFGPVASLFKAEDGDDAVFLANNSIYGLGASIWSSNIELSKKMATLIESGSVFINGLVKSDPRLPFGGIKSSGYGRELSHYGIKEFVNIKTIWIK